MRANIFRIINFLIITRVILYILPWIGLIVLFPDRNIPPVKEYLENWSRWDAGHYLYIAENGYTNIGDPANFIVFLPLFPFTIKILSFLTQNELTSSLFISNLFFVLGGVMFYKLILIDFSEKISKRGVVLMSIFPTAYFFSAPYPESLFIFLIISSFYFARKENWKIAGVMAGFATITRPFGILLAPSLLVELLMSKKRSVGQAALILVPTALGVALYLLINYSIFGSPLEFQKILADNWQKHFALPTVGLLYAWRTAFSKIDQYSLTVGWGEGLATTIAIILIPFAFKFLRRSYAVYYTLSVILFSSTSFILSAPRYLLSIPPFFILLSLITSKIPRIWQFVSIILLFVFTLSYVLGYWSY